MTYGAGARVSTGCVSTIGVRTVSAVRTGCGGGGEEGGGGGPGRASMAASISGDNSHEGMTDCASVARADAATRASKAGRMLKSKARDAKGDEVGEEGSGESRVSEGGDGIPTGKGSRPKGVRREVTCCTRRLSMMYGARGVRARSCPSARGVRITSETRVGCEHGTGDSRRWKLSVEQWVQRMAPCSPYGASTSGE